MVGLIGLFFGFLFFATIICGVWYAVDSIIQDYRRDHRKRPPLDDTHFI